TSDRRRGGILGDARIGILGAVSQLQGLAGRNLSYLVISARNTIEHFVLGQVEFLRAKLRPAQQFDEYLYNIVEVLFQARQSAGRGISNAVGLDLGSADLQVIVELVAGLRFGSAGAPDFSI